MFAKNKLYDIIKYLVLIGIPAFSVAYLAVDEAIDLPNEDAVVKIAAAVAVFLGSLVGLAAAQYNASDEKYDGVIDPVTANTQTSPEALKLSTDEYDAANQKEILLKVVEHPDRNY